MTWPGAHSLNRAELGLCPQVSHLSELSSDPGAVPPPSMPQFLLPAGGGAGIVLVAGLLRERQKWLGLWLQIPKQVTKDEHQHPDRVRLPKSLFRSLKSDRPMVRLGIVVLDIGPGNVFKVRRGTGWLRFNAGFTGTCLPPLESLLRDPVGMKEVMSVSSQGHLDPCP